MFKLPVVLIIIGLFASCSSSPHKEQFRMDNELADQLLKNNEIKEWPTWVNNSGIDGSTIFTVGTYETDDLNIPRHHLISAASMEARGLVLQDAPSQYKAVIQSAFGQSFGSYRSFNKVQTAVVEVNALTGFRTNQRKTACKLEKRYTNTRVKVVNVCKVQGYISIQDLNRAYDYTVKRLYGKEKSDKFKKILDKSFQDNLQFTTSKK